jgi:GNAT acetyltransferase-like protein
LSRSETDLHGELVPLEQFENWDERIATFPQKRIFHEAAWLRFLAGEQKGEAVVLRICDSRGAERALLPGLVVKKGPIRIFGSPLRGWGTVVMGPLFLEGDGRLLVPAAEAALVGAGIRHWEFISEALLPGSNPEESGYRFESSDTHRIRLHTEEPVMWASLQQRCRTAIRKASKNGLSCRISQDGQFVEALYGFVAAIFAKQKFTPPYDAGRLRRLWDALYPLGKAVGFEVRQGEQLAAAGLFIFDPQQAWAWSEGSDSAFNPLAPNNLLYWEAMRYFGSRGVSYLHLPGAAGSSIGKFKASFNPEILSYPFWIQDRDRLLRWARRAYEEVYFLRARWKYYRARIRPEKRAGDLE